MVSLGQKRAQQRMEKARENADLWAAVLAANDALEAAGFDGLMVENVRKAQSNLLLAGRIDAGDLSDDVLQEIAVVSVAREWRPDMGQVYRGEPVRMPDGTVYICTQTYTAQEEIEPGDADSGTVFRAVRSGSESEESLPDTGRIRNNVAETKETDEGKVK